MLKSKTTTDWELTHTAFEALLTRLHANRDEAGLAYESLRLKLTYFFEARGFQTSDRLVDETINRLAHKIQSGEVVRDIEPFALAIARYVWLEVNREASPVSLDELLEKDELKISLLQLSEQPSGEDQRLDIMRQCLLELPAEKLSLLQQYYQAKVEERRKMADQLGISENALYLKIHRLRQKLAKDLAERLRTS